jgi:hypothetical protein
MYATMTRLIDDLDASPSTSDVLEWASPVPYFGAINHARVATVGINPSNREFADVAGTELRGSARRFHTLGSLGMSSWSETTGADVRRIARACDGYFENNPYRQWFDVLDRLLLWGGASLYDRPSMIRACHLDLVAFATSAKWGDLAGDTRRSLVQRGRVPMATIIRDSGLQLLILNGRSVVREFESFAGAKLVAETVPEWTLRRSVGPGVPGVLYTGTVCEIAGVHLGREVAVIGYNHNLQSSFGVTTEVTRSIAARVGQAIVATTND